MFFGQVVATAIAGTVQLGVQAWMFTNIQDICATDQKDGFICPSTQVFGTASIIVSPLLIRFFYVFLKKHNKWGAIGPALQFSKGKIY